MGMGGILDMNCIDGEVESKRVNLGDNLDKSSCYPELLNNYLRCLTGPTFTFMPTVVSGCVWA